MLAETNLLQATFAERLTDEQRSAIAGSPRARRVVLLAEALHLTEPEARAALSEATDLPISTDLTINQAAVPILPARLVRDFHIAPLAIEGATDKQLHLATSWPADDVIIDWIA